MIRPLLKRALLILTAIAFLASLNQGAAQTFTNLHSFLSSEGQGSAANLIVSNNRLYGTMANGGASNVGTVFAVNTDGSAFSVLHNFGSSATDGHFPYVSVTLSGNTLYGMTQAGGPNDRGTLFSVNTDGSGYNVLYNFTNGASEGDGPVSSLILSGNTLYGMTGGGGVNGYGTIFAINTNGSGFNILHNFVHGTNDGNIPTTSLILSGGRLYGTTYAGGISNQGTIFGLNTDGSQYSLLHHFTARTTDGAQPFAGLVAVGNILYGTTTAGGTQKAGTVFSINADGSGFTLLHSFTGDVNDGNIPYASLAVLGNQLYGTTLLGGQAGLGALFALNTDGSSFTLLHSFTGNTNTDGQLPYIGVVVTGNTLYGTTSGGGVYGNGILYSCTLPAPTYSYNLITLSTTNLSLPVSQWTPIYTNTVHYDQPQQFFMLKIIAP